MEHREERVCRTCPGLGRDGADDRPEANYYDYRYACEECRPQLHGILRRIPGLHASLDATPGGGRREHVSGTVEAPLGVRVAVLDELYTGPALTIPVLPVGADQDGTLPTARILHHIAAAWLPAWQESHPREHLPVPAVPALAGWLDDRADWACNTLPELIGDHAGYLYALARRLDRLTDPGTSKPEVIDGVACRDCDRYSLTRRGEDVICTARGCNTRMSPEEYERWTKLAAAHAEAAA